MTDPAGPFDTPGRAGSCRPPWPAVADVLVAVGVAAYLAWAIFFMSADDTGPGRAGAPPGAREGP